MAFPNSFTPKPVDYRGIEEWYRLNEARRTDTDTIYRDSKVIRYRSQETRNRVVRDTEWRSRETRSALNEGETDIVRWREASRTASVRLEERIAEVRKAKKRLEEFLRNKEPYLAAARRCLEIRDRRRDSELVRDRVHRQLNLELQVLEESKRKLVLLGQELWEWLFRLNECSQSIQQEEKSKLQSSQRDNALGRLNNDSRGISLKPTATDTPKNIVDQGLWTERLSTRISEMNETAETCGETVREAYALIGKLELQLQVEREKTEAYFRKRLREMESERDELNRQKLKIEREIGRLYREILESEESLKEANSPLKLAETRLELRKWARNGEIIRDFPRNVLHSEVEAAKRTINELDAQIRKTKQTLFFLQDQLYAVTKAWRLKDDTLKLENLSFETHQSVGILEFRDKSLKLPGNDLESSERIFLRQRDMGILDEFYHNLKISDNDLDTETKVDKSYPLFS